MFFLNKKRNRVKILIVYVILFSDNSYKVRYFINNKMYNEFYKGLIEINVLMNDIEILFNLKKFGKWVLADLDYDGNILRLY